MTKRPPTARPPEHSIAIADIVVGKRHRRELGDISGLAKSIAELGLLHPIVVRPDGVLIAGERRLRAMQLLGWTRIPATMVDLDAVVRGGHAENAERKDFTLSEAVAIKRTLEPLEKAVAKERQQAAGKHGKEGGRGKKKTLTANDRKGSRQPTAAEKASKAAGMARSTIEKAEAIVDAAEAEPEKYGKLLADMDRTGRANGVYRRFRVAKQAEKIRAEPPPLPGNGPYRVATVDLPWPYEKRDEDPSHRAALPYPTMSIAEMCALPVSSLMHEDSILWLWTTNHHVREAFAVLDAWGFEQKTILTWVKANFGTGDWLRGQTEHCLMAIRGKPIVTLTNESTVLSAPARGHSAKPPEFYDLVERLCPAPRYAELFSRYRHNDKWDCHGDEAPAALAPSAASAEAAQ